MEATQVKPSTNGVLRIGRKGKKTFAFGEEGESGCEPFEVDVVAVYNQWAGIVSDYPVKEDGSIGWKELEARNRATVEFVRELTKTPSSPDGIEHLTLAEVLEFIKMIGEEKEKLASFFAPKSVAGPSSQESTELRFSTD